MPARALAEFLRDRRERLHPSEVGLANGARRRTPGLRRDEVALLSRMSTEYYTQLEQARGAHPSKPMLDAIARALRLDRAEHDHLYHLAGEGSRPPRRVPTTVSPSVLALLDRLTETGVMVFDAKQELLGWNRLAVLIFEEDFEHTPPAQRNFARRLFLHPDHRQLLFETSPSATYARYVVADLRVAQARYPEDPVLASLIEQLRHESPSFEHLWQAGEVQKLRHMRKKMSHGTAGVLHLRCDTLVVPEDDQRVVLFTAKPRTRSARMLRMLTGSIPSDLRGTRALCAAE